MQSELISKVKKLRDTDQNIIKLDRYIQELSKMQKRIEHINKIIKLMRGGGEGDINGQKI